MSPKDNFVMYSFTGTAKNDIFSRKKNEIENENLRNFNKRNLAFHFKVAAKINLDLGRLISPTFH
jgi:hypothetical protein